MSQALKIKIEPTEVEEHFSCEKKIKVEDIDLNQSGFDEKSAKKKAKKAAERKRRRPVESKRYRNALENRSSGFFVKNLSSEVTEEKLKSLFSTFGNVTEVKFLKKPISGCAFIKYATKEEALKAVKELHGKKFLQKSIQIQWPKKVPDENLQENDYQPEKKKIKLEMADSEEIQKLKETIQNLKQENFKNDQMAKKLKHDQLKISEENQKLKKCNKKLGEENLKLRNKEKKLKIIKMAKKLKEEKLKNSKKNQKLKKLREENLKLRDGMKELVTLL